MVYVAWIISVIATFLLGFHMREFKKRIEVVEKAIEAKVDKKPEPVEPPSTLIDPTDEVQTAIYERDKLMERLNP